MQILPLLILLPVIITTGTGHLKDQPPASGHRIYTTGFDVSENPFSEYGNWINGKASGIDWIDISSTNGLAIGHQKGNVQYADATAILTGTSKRYGYKAYPVTDDLSNSILLH